MPQTFEEWSQGQADAGYLPGNREAWDAAIASQQATVESLNARLDEYGAKYATLNAVRHDLGLPADADEDAMRDKVQWLTFEHRSLTAQLAEKDREIERLKEYARLADQRKGLGYREQIVRYEAVVEAARRARDEGFAGDPQIWYQLDAALAALEEKKDGIG